VARCVGALAMLALGCPSPPERPSLLLVSVDTLRADRLACYGGPDDVGTGLCSLARRGARFHWAFAPAPATAPSVTSLLTSRYPSQHGVSEIATTTLADAATSVAELLAAAGYDTAAFVSNPVLRHERNLDQGFSVYDDRSTRLERNRAVGERDAEATTDAALAWARVARAPWFLWIHYQDPHGPYDPPGAPPPRDPPGAAPLPLLEDHSGYGGIPRYQRLPGLRSAEGYSRRYLDEVRYLDGQLSRLVAALDAQGSPPAIALTADHGEAFGEDGYWFAHGHALGLDQIRVPLLLRPPGDTPPFVAVRAVSTLDVAPTLLAWAGLASPPGFVGRALGPDPAGTPRILFAEHPLRLAVIGGDLYYARDRAGFDAPRRDPVSGGWSRPLPARALRLPPDTSGPAAPEGKTAPGRLAGLEAALAAHGEGGPGNAPRRPLSPAAREGLRALGYLE
jgi:arylsulfatase A-like enzyme